MKIIAISICYYQWFLVVNIVYFYTEFLIIGIAYHYTELLATNVILLLSRIRRYWTLQSPGPSEDSVKILMISVWSNNHNRYLNEHESLSWSLEEDGNGGGIPDHQGNKGFSVQQQICSKSHLGCAASWFCISNTVTIPCSIMGVITHWWPGARALISLVGWCSYHSAKNTERKGGLYVITPLTSYDSLPYKMVLVMLTILRRVRRGYQSQKSFLQQLC